MTIVCYEVTINNNIVTTRKLELMTPGQARAMADSCYEDGLYGECSQYDQLADKNKQAFWDECWINNDNWPSVPRSAYRRKCNASIPGTFHKVNGRAYKYYDLEY